MAGKRKTMLQIRLILQKKSQGVSIPRICRELSVFRKVVRKYLRQKAKTGLTIAELLVLSDDDLVAQLIKMKDIVTQEPLK